MAACPSCRERLELDESLEGDVLDCPSCGLALQVVSVSPPQVVAYEEEEEEWEDELEDEDEEEWEEEEELEEEWEDEEEWETDEWEEEADQ
ncbi:MAG: hypothetical protein HY335_03040 [Deinococcus sp.]|nr:hypothetical protein [Deinococcus sp.]